jgi:DNA-binding NarL/FixJ family response regulator
LVYQTTLLTLDDLQCFLLRIHSVFRIWCPNYLTTDRFGFFELLHFVLEILAVAGVVIASSMAISFYFNIRKSVKQLFSLTAAMRSGFDNVINEKFTIWKLTKIEQDIALLAIRGSSINEIAELRGSKEGTIKAHLHGIYTKAGVKTRPELMSLIMDEMLSEHSLSASGSIEKLQRP